MSAAPFVSRLSCGTLIASLRALILAACFSAPLAQPATADVDVDVELVLAVDISQSMDEEEQQVQRDGYVAALLSKEVNAAIAEGINGKVAVTYVEWGGQAEQFVVAEWQLIDGPESAATFAKRLAEAPLKTVQRTSIAAALTFAADLFEGNGYTGVRRVIDISGDGPNNQGGLVTASRDAIVDRGVVINGLPLMMNSGGAWYHLPNLDHYYEDCVIGGPGSFLVPVHGLDGFADAIRRKLVMEIAGIAETPQVIRVAARPPVACNMYD